MAEMTLAEMIEKGAREYGTNWLVMLQALKDTASLHGFDLSLAANRELVAALALKAMALQTKRV